MNRLQGKVAVITGGSSGMGFATAEQFVREGAYLYITGRREKGLNAAVAKIYRGRPGGCLQPERRNEESASSLPSSARSKRKGTGPRNPKLLKENVAFKWD